MSLTGLLSAALRDTGLARARDEPVAAGHRGDRGSGVGGGSRCWKGRQGAENLKKGVGDKLVDQSDDRRRFDSYRIGDDAKLIEKVTL